MLGKSYVKFTLCNSDHLSFRKRALKGIIYCTDKWRVLTRQPVSPVLKQGQFLVSYLSHWVVSVILICISYLVSAFAPNGGSEFHPSQHTKSPMTRSCKAEVSLVSDVASFLSHSFGQKQAQDYPRFKWGGSDKGRSTRRWGPLWERREIFGKELPHCSRPNANSGV